MRARVLLALSVARQRARASAQSKPNTDAVPLKQGTASVCVEGGFYYPAPNRIVEHVSGVVSG